MSGGSRGCHARMLAADFDTCSAPARTVDADVGADLLRSLAHADEAPVSLLGKPLLIGVESSTIVLHEQSNPRRLVIHLDAYLFRCAVANGVAHGFLGDSLQLALDLGAGGRRLAVDDDLNLVRALREQLSEFVER